MDLLTHIVSGAAVGGTVGHFSPKKNSALIFPVIGGFGGLLPDVDAISLWSKFDTTIGKWLHLSHPGHVIYSEKFWYSHHGFTHSIFAPVLYGLVFVLFAFLLKKITIQSYTSWVLPLSAFLLAYWIHLLEDLPTPDGPWGGIRLFFPSTTYVGGTGQIWWWNNYDIFLLAFSLLIANWIIHLLLRKKEIWKTRVSLVYTACVFSLIFYQINHRPFDFTYNGDGVNYEFLEQKSLALQEEILGPWLYSIMHSLDQHLPLYF